MKNKLKKFDNWPIKRRVAFKLAIRKILLIIASALVTAYAAALIAGLVSFDLSPPEKITIPIRAPGARQIILPGPEKYLHRFRSVRDSLSRTAEGRKIWDSMLARHPGMMDTVARLEQIITINK